ncbi:MAG: hypothetical protein ACTTHG_03060 [Treponemataceae bacterium]
MKNIKNFFLMLFCFFSIILIFSCNPKLEINILDENSSLIKIDCNNSEEFNNILKNFSETENNTSLFDTEYLKERLKEYGFMQTSVKTQNLADISISTKLEKNQDLNELIKNFVEVKKENSKTKLTFTLSADNAKSASELIPEVKEYLELLAAPIFTGENINEQEYIEILSSFYGKNSVEQLRLSNLIIKIQTPKNIIKAEKNSQSIGEIKTSGNSCQISIPICKYLCSRDINTYTLTY